jgi:hypothetical protein
MGRRKGSTWHPAQQRAGPWERPPIPGWGHTGLPIEHTPGNMPTQVWGRSNPAQVLRGVLIQTPAVSAELRMAPACCRGVGTRYVCACVLCALVGRSTMGSRGSPVCLGVRTQHWPSQLAARAPASAGAWINCNTPAQDDHQLLPPYPVRLRSHAQRGQGCARLCQTAHTN